MMADVSDPMQGEVPSAGGVGHDGDMRSLRAVGDEIHNVEEQIPRLEEEVKKVEDDIRRVDEKITDVEHRIEPIERQVLETSDREERDRLAKTLDYFRQQEHDLRQKEHELRQEKQALRQMAHDLRQEKQALRQKEQALRSTDLVDCSGEWIKQMLLPQPIKLPRNDYDLAAVLFPERHGKLPVERRCFHVIRMLNAGVAKKFLIEADSSLLPLQLSAFLRDPYRPEYSEMSVSLYIGPIFRSLFELWNQFSPHKFPYKLIFNCNERTGDSFSGSTKRSSRPDTLITASGCTFLVGEDKFSSLSAAEEDLIEKMRPLSSMFYGELECILGYIAAGSEFQWVCIDKSGRPRRAGPRLNLVSDSGRCEFLLSIGYAYQLINKMVSSVPDVPGRRAMFTVDVAGDREIYFHHDYVSKSIKNFPSFCDTRMTRLDWILKAYDAGETCPSLPSLLRNKLAEYLVRSNTYKVKIKPIGFSPTLRVEEDTRMLAKNVCQALSVLHQAGLVHRDVRLPNILQVSKDQFVLIDLETVAESPFRVPPGFQHFNEWSDDMLEGSSYTPMSDLYQLGKLLEHRVPWNTTSSASAQEFIGRLQSKQCDAATALTDPWLSNPT